MLSNGRMSSQSRQDLLCRVPNFRSKNIGIPLFQPQEDLQNNNTRLINHEKKIKQTETPNVNKPSKVLAL